MTVGRARSRDSGEEIHLLAARMMGECNSTAMYEGLAVAMKEPSAPSDLSAYAALLVEGGSLPTIDELFDEGRMRALLVRRLGLPASGLLVSWISSQGGRDALAAAYTAPRPSTTELAKWMNRERSTIENDFKGWVQALASDGEQELAFRQAVGEAQLRHERGDHEGTVDALFQALEVRPDDPETLYKLAMTLMQAGREGPAEKRFQRLLELQVAPEQTRYVIFAHYQLGKLYDGRGKRNRARAHYLAMLELPDEHGAHRKAREALGEEGP
jgi:tetratricopeptide (TPR) repeat protein